MHKKERGGGYCVANNNAVAWRNAMEWEDTHNMNKEQQYRMNMRDCSASSG